MTSPPEPPGRWTAGPGSFPASTGAGWRGAAPEEAAVRALERARSGLGDALRRLALAEDVDWVGGPAARYRQDLDGLVDRLRAARAQADVAAEASAEHAASVRWQAVTGPAEPMPAWWTRPALIPGLGGP